VPRVDTSPGEQDHPASAEPLTVAPEESGCRLDWFLAQRFSQFSRVYLRRAINASSVSVDGRRTKASYRVQAGQQVTIVLPDLPRQTPEAEDIPLEILFEDDDLAVVNKPPGMVVHPAKGHWSGTLTSALQFHFEQLSGVGGPTRPGIVHRLDRDTSGVILVAKHDAAHYRLAQQFAAREVEKQYFTVVAGRMNRDRDLIDASIGHHPHQREKMAIRSDDPASRAAQTFYEVIERFDGFTSVRAMPKTGRTHQIRVHLASVGCPVLCDRLYGSRARLTRGDLTRDPRDDIVLLERQALHAERLRLAHPKTGQPLEFEAPLPDDIQATLRALADIRRT